MPSLCYRDPRNSGCLPPDPSSDPTLWANQFLSHYKPRGKVCSALSTPGSCCSECLSSPVRPRWVDVSVFRVRDGVECNGSDVVFLPSDPESRPLLPACREAVGALLVHTDTNLRLVDVDIGFHCSSDSCLSFSQFAGVVLTVKLYRGALLASRPVGLCQQLPCSSPSCQAPSPVGNACSIGGPYFIPDNFALKNVHK